MYSSVHFNGEKLLVDHAEYLKKHDVIYKTPTNKGYEGMMLGDGDTTGMLWNSDSSIILNLNKSDAIDYGEDGNFKAWNWESEEKNSTLISCGRLSISDGMPSFEDIYLEEFQQRLNLSEAAIELNSKTPFSEWRVKAYAADKAGVFVIEVKSSSKEAVEREITLERWGTRSFFHYYEQFVADPSIRLKEVSSGVYKDAAYVKQLLRKNALVTCAKVIGCNYDIIMNNSHSMKVVIPKNEEVAFTILISVATGSGEDILERAISQLEAGASNIEYLYKDHIEQWRKFWEKSFISIEDDYLENLYYINLYQLNCSCRGKLPPTLGSPWAWNRDMRNWGHFYHWNNMQTYWGIHAANHGEFIKNYLHYRFDMLNNAEKDGKEIYGVAGAVFSDISNYNGFQAFEPDTIANFTVGPQIALDFYRHYQYTKDENFLEKYAAPFIKACVDFYCGILKKENGKYCISGGSTPYESYWCLKETITDYSCIKALFSAAIEIAKESIPLWKDILENLYELPLTTYTDSEGKSVHIISTGRKWDGTAVKLEEGIYPLSAFPGCQLSPIFPSGQIGLKDEGTEIFNIAVQTAKIIFEKEVYEKIGCSGHTPCIEVAARLGMKEALKELFNSYIEKFQCYPNGFTHFLDIKSKEFGTKYRPRVLKGKEEYTVFEKLHEKSEGERVEYSSEKFLQMYFEPISNIMAGVNEMLLQSYDGIIRVFPAVLEEESGIFSLLAQGNFKVTSEKRKNEILYVYIESNSGGTCKLCMPWEDSKISVNGQSIAVEYAEKNIIKIDTVLGDKILLEKKSAPIHTFYKERIIAYKNNEVKKKGAAVIGIERRF